MNIPEPENGHGGVDDNPDEGGDPPKKGHDLYEVAHMVIMACTFLAAFGAAIFTYELAESTDALVVSTDNSAQRQLRAYVVPTTIEIESYGERENGKLIWHLIPIWENVGMTPTKFLTIYDGFFEYPSRPDIIPFRDFEEHPEKHFPKSEFMLGPKVMATGASEPKTSDEMTAYANGRMLYVFGLAEYRDVFDKERITKSCVTVNPQKIDWDIYERGRTHRVPIESCPERRFNCADDECKN